MPFAHRFFGIGHINTPVGIRLDHRPDGFATHNDGFTWLDTGELYAIDFDCPEHIARILVHDYLLDCGMHLLFAIVSCRL